LGGDENSSLVDVRLEKFLEFKYLSMKLILRPESKLYKSNGNIY
jgi:hypothetical protein